MRQLVVICSLLFLLIFIGCSDNDMEDMNLSDAPFIYAENLTPVWTSFENHTGEKGAGGMENNGAKGHPYERLRAGESKTLLALQGAGIINRMWITIQQRSPYVLRGLVINMYWDNEEKPAVSVPFGDFFGVGLGRTEVFENALFANAEGRSFVSYLQMPFKKAAKIEVVNDMDFDVSMLFYDVNAQRLGKWDDDYLYFHAYWHRDQATELAKDFEILPKVNGKGRFLGTNISIHSNPDYKDYWWGEGEVKVYLNGDTDLPSLVGTGTEDYIGSGWGQGQYFNRYQGCSIADPENKQWSYYRFHIPDPIYFKTDCKVTIQQMGGTSKRNVIEMLENGVPLIPVTINGEESALIHLYEPGKIVDLTKPDLPGDDAWTNFYRSDDVAAVSYFYLDNAVSELPEIQDIKIRTSGLQ